MVKKGNRVVISSIGEVLWDYFSDIRILGGAPANFVYHSKKMGTETYLISAVGDDPEGNELLRELNEKGIDSKYINRIKGIKTGKVEITITDEGIPRYVITEPAAYDFILASENLEDLAKISDVVSFGTLAQRNAISAETIRNFLDSCSNDCWKILDLNLREPFYNRLIVEESLKRANCLKLNENELYLLADLFDLQGFEPVLVDKLRKRFKIEIIALTKGEEGSVMVASGVHLYQKAEKVQVVDSVGAGDAFTAVLAVGLAHNRPLDEIQMIANRLAAYVCTCRGATPEIPRELKSWINGV